MSANVLDHRRYECRTDPLAPPTLGGCHPSKAPRWPEIRCPRGGFAPHRRSSDDLAILNRGEVTGVNVVIARQRHLVDGLVGPQDSLTQREGL
jgi:hypothetical protein